MGGVIVRNHGVAKEHKGLELRCLRGMYCLYVRVAETWCLPISCKIRLELKDFRDVVLLYIFQAISPLITNTCCFRANVQ